MHWSVKVALRICHLWCSGKTVDEVWRAIHAAQTAGASAGPPAVSYESLPLGALLESMGVMSVEGLGFPLNSVPSYLPPPQPPGALSGPGAVPGLTLPPPKVRRCDGASREFAMAWTHRNFNSKLHRQR